MALRSCTREYYVDLVADLRKNLCGRLASRDLSLGAIALELGYSERQVERILAAAGYDSWTGFITELRMTRAAELLLYGQRVKSVANKVGYRPQHLAEPFVRYSGVTPSEARRIGQVRGQLVMFSKYPLRSADLAARCRAVDRWARLYREAREFAGRAASGTPAWAALDEALQCAPPPRPVPHPLGRRQRKRQRRFLGAVTAVPTATPAETRSWRWNNAGRAVPGQTLPESGPPRRPGSVPSERGRAKA